MSMFDYTGKIIFLGIDVHKRTYSVSAMCEGCIMKHDTFIASPEALVKYCQRAFKGATIKSAYEAGFCGFVLHRFLITNGIQNIVVHPASIEVESRNHKKTDKRDSKKIATQLAAGRLHSVHIPTVEKENRRYVSRLRETFVRQRIRAANQLKSLLNLNGVIPWDESPRISKKWLCELLSLELNEDLRFCIKKLAEVWLYFSKEIVNIEKKLNLLTPEEEELYKAYHKIPGIGSRIARTLVHELGDTLQFSNEEKLFSFCGLTPSEHSSREHKRLGHITHQGNPILRKVLVQAAWVAIKKDPCFMEFFNKLSAKKRFM
jgi:transposase